MLDPFSIKRETLILVLFVFSVILSSCAPVDPMVMTDPSVDLSWPSKPDVPRIRYMRNINGPEDIFPGKSKFQKLTEVITGDNRELVELITPSAVAVSDENILYIADPFAGIVHRYDLEFRTVSYISKAGDEQLKSPVAIAVDHEQNLYISDSVISKVFKLGSNGILIKELSPVGGFKRPAGIAITVSGEKYIVDVLANKLHKFSKDDFYLGEFPKLSDKDELNTPSYVAVDVEGNVYIIDAMNFAVKLYDNKGTFVRKIGEAGDVPGTFARPKGIALDSENNIYVVDATHDNAQIFNSKGELLLYFGKSGPGPGEFYLPNGICIDRMDRIFIADTFNRRIQVFKLLKSGAKNE